MKYEVIFCIFALVLTAGVVGAFAWALLGHSKGGRAEEARTADNLAGLREEYAHLVEQQAAGRLTQAAFAEREEELALRVLEETEGTEESADPSQGRKDADNARTSLITTAAVAVMIPATAVGAYLWYGDFSALDERAVEQVRLAAQAAKSERDMQGTMASLEKAVQSNKDNLEAWELLAEQYNATGNLSQAAIAFENVVRLAPKNANAWAELADLTIALNPSDLLKAGEMAEKALAVDPWHQKGLMIGAAAAFERGDYAHAAVLFDRLRKQIPAGNEVHDALTQQIEMTLAAGGLKAIPKDDVGEKPETDLEKMMKLGGGMQQAPERGQDGVGLNPLKR
ncbi:c-type cytochrome biogenesis protein CcmI [Sutterella wadsworthensis]|uniref:c-type cytochrome biogenesis protein CcmI n=1 Tax=Sutterella wadsworthensis TaxID=40545 RepID=UPI002673BC58|nr:c-type cytochrome biogenesis protein CcmI [Sutterella wadsworthensis]